MYLKNVYLKNIVYDLTPFKLSWFKAQNMVIIVYVL